MDVLQCLRQTWLRMGSGSTIQLIQPPRSQPKNMGCSAGYLMQKKPKRNCLKPLLASAATCRTCLSMYATITRAREYPESVSASPAPRRCGMGYRGSRPHVEYQPHCNKHEKSTGPSRNGKRCLRTEPKGTSRKGGPDLRKSEAPGDGQGRGAQQELRVVHQTPGIWANRIWNFEWPGTRFFSALCESYCARCFFLRRQRSTF